MDVELYPPMPGRPCRFCLCLQGACVFADFDVDEDDQVYAVRVSFDGFGCCRLPPDITRMPALDSAELLAMIARQQVEPQVAGAILRRYFGRVRDVVWADALAHHDLL